MSHFAVLVIGPNVEKQLQPFHQFECTGVDDEYVIEVEEDLDDADDYLKVEFGAQPNLKGEHKYGYVMLNAESKAVKFVRRTNPNYKWDWWMVGGRWSRFLTDHDGNYKNEGLKKDFNLKAKKEECLSLSESRWEEIQKVIAGREFYTWSEMREMHKDDIDSARVAFNQQQVIIDLTKAGRFDFYDNTSEFKMSKEEFVKTRTPCTFAILMNGEWITKGEMGWFGMSNNTFSDVEWAEKWWEVIDSLDDETQLAIVDCHI
jgi:hypothetical protein